MNHIIRTLGHKMAWTAFLLVTAVVVTRVSAAQTQSGSYDETFNNGAPGWKLDAGWSAGDGLLLGREVGRALYADGNWHDAHYRVVVRSLQGTPSFLFMDTGQAWYYVYIQSSNNQISAQLYYTSLGQEFPPKLGEGSFDLLPSTNLAQVSSLILDVIAQGRQVEVRLNDKPVIQYTSDTDEPGGTIGFEVTKGALIAVDEVSVDPIQPTPVPPASADLAIRSISLEGVRRGSVMVDLAIDIANDGGGGSPPTKLVAFDQDQPDVRAEAGVDSIPAGGSLTIRLTLEGPDDWADTDRRFVAQVDPDNTLGETNRSNKELVSSTFHLSLAGGGGPPLVPPADGRAQGLVPLIIGGLVVLGLGVAGGMGLTIRNQIRFNERQKLQREARPGEPPDHCTPPHRYVGVETEVELKLMKMTEVEITLLDPATRTVRRKQTIKEPLPIDLNAAVRAHWLREPEERFASRLNGLAKSFSKTITDAAYREQDLCDVSVMVHLEGIEVKSTFTLYHCVKQGSDGVWKKVTSWEVKKTQQRDDPVFGLESLDTGATSMATRLEVLIEPLIRGFVDRY